MLTEIKETCAIAKIRISVERDTAKHFKAFGEISEIISSEMPISLLIQS